MEYHYSLRCRVSLRYSIGGSLVLPDVVNVNIVEQCAGSKTLRKDASVCLFVCVWECTRIYILIRNCLCVYFLHSLVIHFIDVCSIVTMVR